MLLHSRAYRGGKRKWVRFAGTMHTYKSGRLSIGLSVFTAMWRNNMFKGTADMEHYPGVEFRLSLLLWDFSLYWFNRVSYEEKHRRTK